jgi:hypothetical protein
MSTYTKELVRPVQAISMLRLKRLDVTHMGAIAST